MNKTSPYTFPKPRRALDPETGEPIPVERKQILQGYLTKLGVLIAIVGLVLKLIGKPELFPETELKHLIDVVSVNLDALLLVFGALTALYGNLRRRWRKPSDTTPHD